MSRMKKKKRVKAKKERMGRVGYIPFGNEKIKVVGLSNKIEKDLNDKFMIEDIQYQINHYIERLNEKSLPDNVRLIMEDKLTELSVALNKSADMAGTQKLKMIVQKPEEWIDALSSQELYNLKMKVFSWVMYVDVNELYMELFKEAEFHFLQTKPTSNVTGQEVGEYLHKLELEYLSLKKKPECLSTALQNAQEERAKTVFSTLPHGPDE